MTWIFSLSAECGTHQETSDRLAKHFSQTSWQHFNSVPSKCIAETFQDSEDNWWTRVSPSPANQLGITTAEDAYQMTELGILLYKHLQSAPPFRYAIVGVEVDEFRTYSELLNAYNPANISFPGLVLSKALWQLVGSPLGFRTFSPGYLWKPYEGEVYKPLIGSAHLRDKLNELYQI